MLGEVKPPDSASTLTVTTAAAAVALADPALQRYLEPFIARDGTVAQAARELGVTTNSLLYRVRRLEAAGLLRVVRLTPRAGRPVKVYRSVADAFYLPFALTREATLEALMLTLDRPFQTLFYENVVRALRQTDAEVGLLVWRTDETGVLTRVAAGPGRLFDPLSPGAPSVLPFWSPEVWLGPDDAKALLRDLTELIRRYHGRGGSQRYLLHLGVSPLEDG